MLEGEDVGEQVAELVDPRQHVGGLEPQLDARSTRTARPRPNVTGVDTVGSCRARSEYGAIVVLWWAFWLQSTNTLPGRSTLAITVVTRPGSWRSITWPTARAKSAVASWVTSGVFSGT